MRGYRDPALQAKRWEAQANAWTCPNGCGHDDYPHREYQPTWERGEDGPVRVPHPLYRFGVFACAADGCDCEVET